MNRFVLKYNLRSGDRLIIPRSNLRIIQHHAIYWGMINGVHHIIENQEGFGVRFITMDEFFQGVFEITQIEYFIGNEIERAEALNRAYSLIGKNYDLFNFNCEHFANHVQYGKIESKQVESFTNGIKLLASATLLVIAFNAIRRQ